MTIVRLSDALVSRLLQNPALLSSYPEFSDAAAMLKSATSPAPGRCAPCTRNKYRVSANQAATQVILSLDPARRQGLKSWLGVPPQDQIKVFQRVGGEMREVLF